MESNQNNIMGLDEYQKKCFKTNKYMPNECIYCEALGLSSEAGEVAGKVDKFIRKYHTTSFNDEQREAIAKEIGDVLWFAASLAKHIGYDLSEIAQMNLDKLASRNERNVICTDTGGDDR